MSTRGRGKWTGRSLRKCRQDAVAPLFQRRDQVVRQVRVGLVQHVIDAGLDQRKGFRAWKDVEAVICDRFESDFGNFIGRDGAVLHRLLGSCPGGELGFGQRRCIQQMCRAVPIGVTNFRRHILKPINSQSNLPNSYTHKFLYPFLLFAIVADEYVHKPRNHIHFRSLIQQQFVQNH